ncbi:DoxX family membrane protein [Mucilaginibacter sp.]|uniref:DoxX family protein n=1 Tax=Mucilaginibacter sp. TaxID=1882438 RepID=UPI00326345B1
MKPLLKFEAWGNRHHPKLLDLVRMLLGLFLVMKGSIFFTKYAFLRDIIMESGSLSKSPDLVAFLINYVTYVHIVGGVLIFIGLYTRLAALLQLPIVFGAIFFINILSSFVNSELWLSVLVMALLMLFVLIGSGPLSLDYFINRFSFHDEEH